MNSAQRFGTAWIMAVIGHHDGSTPIIAVQPDTEAGHGQVLRRLRAGGWPRLSRHEWESGRWPIAPAGAVDVVDRTLVRFTTGAASFYTPTADDGRLTPMWLSAARERRALVALVTPGTFTGPDGIADDPDAAAEPLSVAAAGRTLYAALCTVRFDVFTGARPAAPR